MKPCLHRHAARALCAALLLAQTGCQVVLSAEAAPIPACHLNPTPP